MPNPPTPSVFISYRQALSGPVARQIHDGLQDMGADAFFDVDDIHLGDNWRAKLTAQLAARDYFIVILHPATLNESEWVAREIEMALDLHKPIIPIFTDGFSYNHPNVIIPPAIARLKDIQGIEYNYKRPQPTFDALAQTLNLPSQPTPAVGARHASSAAEPPARPGMSDTLKAAIITGIFGVIVAVVTIVPNLLPKAAETPTPSPTTQAVIAPSNTPPPTDAPTTTDAPSITPLPPTPTPTPSVTPVPTDTPVPPTAIVVTATPMPTNLLSTVPPTAPPVVQAFPCEATIISGGGSANLLNVVRFRPAVSESIVSSVRVGQVIRIRREQNDNVGGKWYQVEDSQTNYLGWIQSQYVQLSNSCPQS